MSLDPRFIQGSGPQLFSGNELLVKGALEAEGGVHLFTGYPGSPVAGFFDTLERIAPLLAEHGQVAKLANNEAISAAMVNGAQMAGCRAITAFKSVGLHVASDALALGVLAGTRGDSGGLIVVGDDPWSDSTQVPSDSRFLAEHLRLPIIEPAGPQEVKDWVDLAFKLGKAGQTYIGYCMTVTLADGGGTVQCRPNQFPEVNTRQQRTLSYAKDIEPNLEETVLLPPRTWQRELTLADRLNSVKAAARKLGINRLLHRPQKGETAAMGFIAAGSAYAYLAQALQEMGLWGRIPVLKLGMHYPLDDQSVLELARQCEQVYVIEERRSFVERQVHELIGPLRQAGEIETQIYGKKFPGNLAGIPETRGLNPSLLVERLIPLVRLHPTLPIELTNGRLSAELDRIAATAQQRVNIPDRSPTFCPGCPHRDSSSVLLELRQDLLDPEYMLKNHQRKPVDLVCHGDTGCYTMLMFEPNKPLMHNYSGMGLGGGTGSGADPFIQNKQMVFMGDGTFFHSGQVAISHSVQSGQDITYVILENKTTAMTGHQGHAGVETDLMGQPMQAQEIERVVRSMFPAKGRKDVRIVRINPEDRDRYRQLLEQTLLADGVKVVIADKECGITLHRRVRKEEAQVANRLGYLPKKTYMNVASQVCEHCLECTTQTGCPGLKFIDTDYGPKVQTDLSSCVNDGACQRIDACPSFEEVTVLRKGPKRRREGLLDVAHLPEPPRPVHAEQDTWRAYLAGVGGMGIGTATAILTLAGHHMGYHVQFLDKKGLAIRNGGVFSQLVYTRPGDDGQPPLTTPLIPYGKADLILGVDLLEACRAVDPKHPCRVAAPDRTAAVLNTSKTATVPELMGKDAFDPAELEDTLRKFTHPERFAACDLGELSEHLLGSKLYVNVMLLGMAYQCGLLPLTREAVEKAVRQLVGKKAEQELLAFDLGRKVVAQPEAFGTVLSEKVETARQATRRKRKLLVRWKGREQARQFQRLLRPMMREARAFGAGDALRRDIVIRAADCLVWGGVPYARHYLRRVLDVLAHDRKESDFAATRVVAHNLAKVMLIKDEVFVASLLTSPEKYEQDMQRFDVDPARGDRLVYRHFNRPEFDLLGLKVRFKWKSRDWQLRLASRATWLRRLLPKWHARERSFRDWYDTLVSRFLDEAQPDQPRDYQRWLAILRTPETVTGYREVRYPKMAAARKRADQLLATRSEAYAEQTATRLTAEGDISLPVLAGSR